MEDPIFSDDSDEESENRTDSGSIRIFDDPMMFAPTGDIYSYVVRRKVAPASFSPPLKYELAKALGGPSRDQCYKTFYSRN